jgi:DNA-binding transcriptional ArsR family regulator
VVELESERLNLVFHALSDPTRRAMLRQLANGEQSIGKLSTPFKMSFEGASKHVRALEAAGLVQRTVVGRTHVCRLRPAPLAAADEWLRFYEHFWDQRLDALDALLKAEDADAATQPSKNKKIGRNAGRSKVA